jgi:hypothetical protein
MQSRITRCRIPTGGVVQAWQSWEQLFCYGWEVLCGCRGNHA